MNSRARLAVGVAIGYLLGRTRKMRLALMVAGATGAATSPRQLMQRGLKQLTSTPEIGKLTTVVRGQLVDAAKTAAVTASSRIDALNERLQNSDGDRPSEEDEPKSVSKGKSAAKSEEDGERRPRTRRRAEGSTAKSRGTSTRRSTRTPVRRAGR